MFRRRCCDRGWRAGGQAARTAVHRERLSNCNSGRRRAWDRGKIEIEVVGYEEIQVAVAIVIDNAQPEAQPVAGDAAGRLFQ